MAKSKSKRWPSYRRCENCRKRTRVRGNSFVEAYPGVRWLTTICRKCREEIETFHSTLQEFAELDPTGPAAYALTGDESMLRRGYR